MVVPRFVEQARSGRRLQVLGDGLQTRCFAHVLDVVAALHALADTPLAAGEVFNVGSQDEVTVLELAERVMEAVGVNRPIDFAPLPEGTREPRRSVPDIARIADCTGWAPTRGLDDIVRDAVRRADGRALVHVLVPHGAAATGALGLVQRLVGAREHAAKSDSVSSAGLAVPIETADVRAAVVAREGGRDGVQDGGGGLVAAARGAGDPDRELVAAEPAGDALGREPASDLGQHEVAGGVAVAVVDGLEVVDVADQDAARPRARTTARRTVAIQWRRFSRPVRSSTRAWRSSSATRAAIAAPALPPRTASSARSSKSSSHSPSVSSAGPSSA